MPSCFFRLLLTATSLAPIIGAFSVNQFSEGNWRFGLALLIIGLFLVFWCWRSITFVNREIPSYPLIIKSVQSTDKDMLAFLLAYLLPFLSKEMFNNPIVAIFVFTIIFTCVFHSNAFNFNPILSMLGFHFYEVTNEANIQYMLITKQEILKSDSNFSVKQIGSYVYLDAPEPLRV